MEEIYAFLKECGTYYLATVEGDQPRVRPFGTIDQFDGRLTIQTGRSKSVSAQMHKNPKIEICAFNGTKWLRVCACVEEDPRIEELNRAQAAYEADKELQAAVNEYNAQSEALNQEYRKDTPN